MTTDDREATLESVEIVCEPDIIDTAAPGAPEAALAPLPHAERAPALEDTLPGIGVPPPPWGYGPGIWTGHERRRP